MGILTAQQDAELNRAGTSGMGHFRVMRTTDASSGNSGCEAVSVRNCVKQERRIRNALRAGARAILSDRRFRRRQRDRAGYHRLGSRFIIDRRAVGHRLVERSLCLARLLLDGRGGERGQGGCRPLCRFGKLCRRCRLVAELAVEQLISDVGALAGPVTERRQGLRALGADLGLFRAHAGQIVIGAARRRKGVGKLQLRAAGELVGTLRAEDGKKHEHEAKPEGSFDQKPHCRCPSCFPVRFFSPNQAGCPVCFHPIDKLRMPLFETRAHLRQI
ncbi:hypothetical protein RHECNPAF_1340016 [Rhizobium etli CNPAF512]|nr:hypothetical protein RHECNPAF_1340016 [Rhizobium etli CNPAF512]